MREIARAFCVSEFLLAGLNGLQGQPATGMVLQIPVERGNEYIVRAGDTCELLCGSIENFRKKNGVGFLYIGMRVIL